MGDPGWNHSDLTGSAFTSEIQFAESCPLFGGPKGMCFGNQEEKPFSRAVINFDRAINECFRWRNYSKKTYEGAEGRRQKVRMFLYKSKVTFAWQGCNTSVQIQTLCWLKEQVSISYYTKHLYLLTTFLLPAVAIIHWSPARPWKVFPFNRKKRSLSKPLTVIC